MKTILNVKKCQVLLESNTKAFPPDIMMIHNEAYFDIIDKEI